jgi:carbonic anhydrase/acetyltransferase-like protein (isoleucine patch superfamily)
MVVVAGPFLLALAPVRLAFENPLLCAATICLAPFIYAWTYLLICGLFSMPYHKYIIAGSIPRDLSNPRYRGRRVYGLCWTFIYYNKPLYHLYLSSPLMKHCLFRLFGYKGQMNFTIYPDAWIRDLPLLDFGVGSYIANRSTLGTNIALTNGDLLVGPIHVGDGATVGHLALVALGTSIGARSEIGVGTDVGLNNTIGDSVIISPATVIGHRIEIGDNVHVGMSSYVGNGANISGGIRIPPGAIIGPRAKLTTRNDIATHLSSQTRIKDITPEQVSQMERNHSTPGAVQNET